MNADKHASYFHVRPGRSARTDEVVAGLVFVDYDADDNLLGVEVLALPTEHVADLHFQGGRLRPVYEEPDGRQYVIADDGERVYGVWFIPPEVGPDVAIKEQRKP